MPALVTVTLALALGSESGARPASAGSCVPAWRVVESPRVGSGQLNSVAARSPDDAWAVGYLNNGAESPLIEHWNGSRWAVMRGPARLGPLAERGCPLTD
jgi:hypothetical protein